MALIKFGGGITEMRGSIAGNVFSRNRYGAYSRARTVPVNPNTELQTIVRAAMSFLVARWGQTLTALQRAAWNLYGSNVVMNNKLGESINLTGFNHYIRSNMIRKQIGIALIDDGPVIFEIPASDPTYTITASEATQQITHAYDDTMAWADETGAHIFFFQGQPQNAQRNFFGGPWRVKGGVNGIDGAPTPSPYVGPVAFAIAEGQHQWCYARILRADGRLSEPFRDDVLTGA